MSTLIKEPGNWDPSWENFKPEEFQCSHCQALMIHSDIMDLLQEAREELGPMSITSGYRCGVHNSLVSKTGLKGPHTTGKAVDISVRDSQHRKQLITYFAPIVSGFKIILYVNLLFL